MQDWTSIGIIIDGKHSSSTSNALKSLLVMMLYKRLMLSNVPKGEREREREKP